MSEQTRQNRWDTHVLFECGHEREQTRLSPIHEGQEWFCEDCGTTREVIVSVMSVYTVAGGW